MKIYRTGSVTSAAIPDGSITNADISASAAIDFSKLANVSATDKVLGRSTAGAGAVEEIACTAAGRSLIAGASATAQKVTLFGALPTAYTQTYATATRTHSNPAAASVATTGATNVTPFGYTTSAQADAIRAAVNNLVTDVANIKQVLNQVIDDLQAAGLLQ